MIHTAKRFKINMISRSHFQIHTKAVNLNI